jgi:hypothetical protein
MSPADWIALLLIALIVGGATAYIVKEKKKGRKCIGCPYSATCQSARKGECGCASSDREDKS